MMDESFEERPDDQPEESLETPPDETEADEPTIKHPALEEEDALLPEQVLEARQSIFDEVYEEGQPPEEEGFPMLPLVLGIGAILCGLALIAVTVALIFLPNIGLGAPADEEPSPVDRTLVFPTATIGEVEIPAETEEVQEEEPEVEAPTNEPAPTAEPTATDAPPQNPTSPPPPPPPPTDPPPTDPPPPPPVGIEGLTGVNFWVDNPVVAVNERISFNFSLTNSGTESIIFGPLGVAVQDTGGTTLAFHTSWTRWELEPDRTENWNDGVTIGNPGSYLLELSACVPNNDDHCDVSGGTWYVLSAPVAVTVN